MARRTIDLGMLFELQANTIFRVSFARMRKLYTVVCSSHFFGKQIEIPTTKEKNLHWFSLPNSDSWLK